MKVVYLNPSGQLGGAEKVLLDILASLKAAEPSFRPHLVVSADGPLIAKARSLGVPTTLLPFPAALARLGDCGAGGPAGRQIGLPALLGRLTKAGGAAALYLNRLRHELKRLSPDILHTNGFKMHLLGMWAKPRRTPIIWHIHDYISARPLMARALPRFAKRCAAIIAISNSVADDVRTVCGDSARVHTIYNAVDLERFSPAGPQLDLDELAGLPPATPGTVKVALFATMARWKGHEVFMRALSLLPADLPVRAYIAGDALYQTDGSQYSIPELRRMAKDLGVAEKVGFTGFIAEPAAAMRACDIVVHASTQPEPFGLVIIEAMACARAVVISQAGGAAELIAAGENALAHAPGDAPGLAACIMRLARDANLRAQLGQAGRAAAERRFDRARPAYQLLPTYQLVCVSRDLPTVWESSAAHGVVR
ncbi:MAG: glycosyltransferase [Acidobacteriota bacterium]